VVEHRSCKAKVVGSNPTGGSEKLLVRGLITFGCWVSELTKGSYRPATADEFSERSQLEAVRKLLAERRALHRLQVVIDLEKALPATAQGAPASECDNTELRIEEAKRRISQLEIYLGSAGWGIQSDD
jgi:hypothetical protein